jgi:hypothetical protein
MNPAKCRNTYGKLMFIMMDTESVAVKSELKLDFTLPILTVASYLDDVQASNLLEDPLVQQATRTIENTTGSKSRDIIIKESTAKTLAAEQLVNKYASDVLSKTDIIRVIESLSDNNAFLSYNVQPVQSMITLLTTYFNEKTPSGQFSLSLSGKSSSLGFSLYSRGSGGAKLNHDHKTQYTFVLQSLCLWREIMAEMPRLWCMADRDMVAEHYRLANTGQGYHRVQSCPHVGATMRGILSTVQSKVRDMTSLSFY